MDREYEWKYVHFVRYRIVYCTSASYNNEQMKYDTNVVTVYGRHTYHFWECKKSSTQQGYKMKQQNCAHENKYKWSL